MKNVPDNSTPDPFEVQVFRGLLAEGYVIPQTAAEVRAAETGAVAPASSSLPENLRDPDAVLRRIKERIAGKEGKTIPFPLPEESGVLEELEELERAARHGNALPEAIEKKMAENRRTADQQFDTNEPG